MHHASCISGRRLRFGILGALPNIRLTKVGRWKMSFGGRQPVVEDDLWWEMTFGGRRLMVEDDLWGKTTFIGGRPLVDLAEQCHSDTKIIESLRIV